MNKWLRTDAPYTFFLLLIYALAVNFYYFSHSFAPVSEPLSDGLLYQPIVNWLRGNFHFHSKGFTILTFFIIFLQALILNALVNRFKIFPGESFFTAYCFIIFSCFFPDWHAFSAILLACLPLLIFIHQLFTLFETENGKTVAFNLGLLVGIMSLLYFPALIFIFLIWFALLMARPFHVSEWILVILGLITPWYFFSAYLFLTEQLSLLLTIPIPGFSFPSYLYSYKTMIGLPVLLFFFLYGSYQLQRYYPKMVIKDRKIWTTLIAFTIFGILLPFLPDRFYTNGWWMAFFPMTLMISSGFFYTKKKWISNLLHLIALGFIVYLQWLK